MARFARSIVVPVLVLVLSGLGATAAAAKGQNTTAGAEAAADRLFEYINDRQWGAYYRSLHPAQQALVPKDAFTACYDTVIPEGLSVNNVEVTVATKSTMTIPGTDTPAKVKELTVKYTLERGDAEQGVTDRTVLIWVKNTWTWVMSAGRVAECTAE